MFTIVMMVLAILQSAHVIDLAMKIWEVLIVLYVFYVEFGLIYMHSKD